MLTSFGPRVRNGRRGSIDTPDRHADSCFVPRRSYHVQPDMKTLAQVLNMGRPMRWGKYDRASRKWVHADSGRVPLHKNEIIASPQGERPSPAAYLVEQDAHLVVRSHFHIGSQFQVFV